MYFHPINTFWFIPAQTDWPRDRDDHVFLGRATCQIGSVRFPGLWSDDDMMYLGAPDPGNQTFVGDEIDRFLAQQAYGRAVKAYEAGQRAANVATLMLKAAEDKRMVLASRSIRAGNAFHPLLHLNIDNLRSMHLFRSCTFDPSTPFDPSTQVLARHNLFVTETSLERIVRGLHAPKVPSAALAAWIEANTSVMNQAQLIVASRTAFPGFAAPTDGQVRIGDRAARKKLGLRDRERGAPKRGTES
ncbi:hypothetical protein [Sphingomonas sp. PWP1-2]|uniref:hypothetical protein n=1 Tax=Sphingomonas sp. PWP1-2 TaxID=2804558 RepID=UPI003CE7B718